MVDQQENNEILQATVSSLESLLEARDAEVKKQGYQIKMLASRLKDGDDENALLTAKINALVESLRQKDVELGRKGEDEKERASKPNANF